MGANPLTAQPLKAGGFTSSPRFAFLLPMHRPEFTAASVVAVFLLFVPLPSQLRVRNVAVVVLIGGTIFIHLIHIVNTLVWASNVRDVAPIWCDIGLSLMIIFFSFSIRFTNCVIHSYQLLVLLPSDGGRCRTLYL